MAARVAGHLAEIAQVERHRPAVAKLAMKGESSPDVPQGLDIVPHAVMRGAQVAENHRLYGVVRLRPLIQRTLEVADGLLRLALPAEDLPEVVQRPPQSPEVSTTLGDIKAAAKVPVSVVKTF